MKRKSSIKEKVKSIKEKVKSIKEKGTSKKGQVKSKKERKIKNKKLQIENEKLIPICREKSRFIGKKIEKRNAGEVKKTAVEISELKGEPVKDYKKKSQKEKEIKPAIKKIEIKGKMRRNKKEFIKDDKILPVVNAKVEVSPGKRTIENKTTPVQKNKTIKSINYERQKIVQEQHIKEAGKVQKQEKQNNQKTTAQKLTSIGWKYFLDKQGNPLMKIYTENSSVYFKLEKYGEIKKSARYYTHKGDLVGADFIIPFNLILTACDLAGIKTPKGIPVAVVD